MDYVGNGYGNHLLSPPIKVLAHGGTHGDFVRSVRANNLLYRKKSAYEYIRKEDSNDQDSTFGQRNKEGGLR